MNFSQLLKNFFFLLVAIFSGVTLLVISLGVSASGDQLSPFNAGVEQIFVHLRTPLLTSLMLLITNIGSPFVLSVLAILLSIFLILQRDLYDTMLYAVSIIGTIVIFMVMKNGFALPRPDSNIIAGLSGWSYPSGHAAVATAFFFATGYSFFDWPKHWPNRVLLVILCIAGAIAVSVSRLYLGAHFALDVLAGTSIGLLSVSVTVLVFNMFLSERRFWRQTLRGL